MSLNKILIFLSLVVVIVIGLLVWQVYLLTGGKYAISTESRIKGRQLLIRNRAAMVKLLDENKFSEKSDWDTLVKGGEAGKKLKKIKLILTDEYLYQRKEGVPDSENSAKIYIEKDTLFIETQSSDLFKNGAWWAETRFLRIVIGRNMLDPTYQDNVFKAYQSLPPFFEVK